MKVNVLFFGATADIAGTRSVELPLSEPLTAGIVFNRVIDEYQGLHGRKLLFSVNQEYVPPDRIVNDGDELAVFTAVSGG